MHPAAPVEVTERFAPNLRPGGKPTRVDLRYKVQMGGERGELSMRLPPPACGLRGWW